MAEVQLLGLFHEATPTADTIDQLRKLGVPDDKITILSSMPYRPAMMGRPAVRTPVGKFALAGAILGLATGMFLTVGIFLLYPLEVGGQPLVPVPPSIIILFEATMLGTMWATFLGLLLGNRFPSFRPLIYDPRITEGHIGLAFQVDSTLVDPACHILEANGAHHLKRAEVAPATDRGFRIFWAAAVVLLVILSLAVLLPAYSIVQLPIPSNMVDQDSIAYDQGPRRAAPAEAIPVQGLSLIAGQPASTPSPSDGASIQRGAALYADHCEMCHGSKGFGDGPLSHYFSPRPASLAGGRVKTDADADLFVVITRGRGLMPALAENLSPSERWDVIHYVRTLEQ